MQLKDLGTSYNLSVDFVRAQPPGSHSGGNSPYSPQSLSRQQRHIFASLTMKVCSELRRHYTMCDQIAKQKNNTFDIKLRYKRDNIYLSQLYVFLRCLLSDSYRNYFFLLILQENTIHYKKIEVQYPIRSEIYSCVH